jgi:uncharacterized iron-regulated membrane protein
MNIIATSRKIHKWLALLVGLQLLIWSLSGTYMVLMNIDFIHGDSLVKDVATPLNFKKVVYSLEDLRSDYPDAEKIQLLNVNEQPYYKIRLNKQTILLDATTGEQASPLSYQQIEQIARSHYRGKGLITEHKLLLTKRDLPSEVSARILPAWKIVFADFANPTLYISQNTGAVVTKRHDYWRLFDLFFRLHIMDYNEGEDASNQLLFWVSILALVTFIAGSVLTYVSFVQIGGRSLQMPKRAKTMPWVRYFHRWASVIVLVQLLIWLGTGLFFNLMDHTKASGNALRQPVINQTTHFDLSKFYPLSNVLLSQPPVLTVELIALLDKPYYALTFAQGLYAHFPHKISLINAYSGEKVQIDSKMASALAQQSVNKAYEIKSVEKLLPPFDDIAKQQNPLWQIMLADEHETAIYIDAQTGNVVAHSNSNKRFADWMYRLHFMDYANNGHFNNIQIIVLAIAFLWLAISGSIWTVHLLMNGHYRLKRKHQR